MSVQLFLSGVEGVQHFDVCVDNGIKNVLLSYFYIRSVKDPDFLKKRKEANPAVNIMIDSGGYSFRANASNLTTEDYVRYRDEYVEFLDSNSQYLHSAVELDVEDVLGYGEIRQWQIDYFEPLENKLRILYIWHQERGLGELEAMAKRHRYIGVNALIFDIIDPQKVVNIARKYLTAVHGFAITGQRVLRTLDLATADSITWKSAERFGDIFVFNGDRFNRRPKAEMRQHEQYIRSVIGNGYDRMVAGDYKELSVLAVIAHAKLQEVYDSKDSIDYWSYRLPHHKKILNMRQQEIQELAAKFEHLERPEGYELNRATLRFLSALQEGDWTYLDAQNQGDNLDLFLALVGTDCWLSYTNKEQAEDIRRHVCSLSLPHQARSALKRVDTVDFHPRFLAQTRGLPEKRSLAVRPK